jgi:hypothetical protein
MTPQTPATACTFPSDYIRPGDGTPSDDAAMSTGWHFDYVDQCWRNGHDHAHFATDTGPLLFCGADLATCQGVAR